jgi:uncharacterized protein DUF3618
MTTNETGAHRADDSSAPGTDDNGTDTSPEVAELQADIERTRADLADTVDQLTAKLDVKTRVRSKVAETKDTAGVQLRKLQDQATDDNGRPTPATIGVGGGTLAAAVAVLVFVLWRRNNTPRRIRRRR